MLCICIQGKTIQKNKGIIITTVKKVEGQGSESASRLLTIFLLDLSTGYRFDRHTVLLSFIYFTVLHRCCIQGKGRPSTSK